MQTAAIYESLSKRQLDQEHATLLVQLAKAEIGSAQRWAAIAGLSDQTVHPRYSVSLTLLNLADRLFDSQTLWRFLDVRHRRTLIASSEDIQYHGLQQSAIATAALLRELSDDEDGPENQHQEHGFLASRSGALRAGVLGVNDGLISNFSLAMGMAAGTSDPSIVILAGLAGLLAGALSMAAGEYISVVSQREFYANLVEWERAELILWHEEEEAELARIYEEKGLERSEAHTVASRIMRDPDTALDVHVREELGIDPGDLGGSPWTAAIASFATFSVGAFIPVTPYILGAESLGGILSSAVVSGASLLIVGGGLGWITGTGIAKAGFRMLVLGSAAAAITYGLGSLVGQVF